MTPAALPALKSLCAALQSPASYTPQYAPTLLSRMRRELPEIYETLKRKSIRNGEVR